MQCEICGQDAGESVADDEFEEEEGELRCLRWRLDRQWKSLAQTKDSNRSVDWWTPADRRRQK